MMEFEDVVCGFDETAELEDEEEQVEVLPSGEQWYYCRNCEESRKLEYVRIGGYPVWRCSVCKWERRTL